MCHGALDLDHPLADLLGGRPCGVDVLGDELPRLYPRDAHGLDGVEIDTLDQLRPTRRVAPIDAIAVEELDDRPHVLPREDADVGGASEDAPEDVVGKRVEVGGDLRSGG